MVAGLLCAWPNAQTTPSRRVWTPACAIRPAAGLPDPAGGHHTAPVGSVTIPPFWCSRLLSHGSGTCLW